MIFAFSGTLRCNEMVNLKFSEVHDKGDIFYVEINNSKNYVVRRFVIDSEFYHRMKNYINLRPTGTSSNRFFLCYRNGVCTRQPIGINTFYKQPKINAKFLNLDEPNKFTGHCFRRSSASLLAESGADLMTIKKAGGWKTDAAAQGYIDFSVHCNKQIGRTIAETITSGEFKENNLPPYLNNAPVPQAVPAAQPVLVSQAVPVAQPALDFQAPQVTQGTFI